MKQSEEMAVRIEKALIKAYISSFYSQKLLNAEETEKICKELRKRGIMLDKITLKSDVCNQEVHHYE